MSTVDKEARSNGGERAIADYMRELGSATLTAVPSLPGADVVWLKASLVQRWKAERRVELPLDRMDSVHLALGVVAAVVLFTWSAPALLHTLSSLHL